MGQWACNCLELQQTVRKVVDEGFTPGKKDFQQSWSKAERNKTLVLLALSDRCVQTFNERNGQSSFSAHWTHAFFFSVTKRDTDFSVH